MINILLLVLVVAIAAVLLYAASRPDTFRVARTASMNAPPESIFPLIDSLRAGEKWSPYYRKDPAMKGAYSGPECGTGATFDFSGNKDVGSGRLTIVGSESPGKVTMRLQMFKPFAADNVVEFTLVPRGEATEVTWAMQGNQPFLGKVMSLVFDMEKMVGTEFAAGLGNLKTIVEA